MKKIGLFALGLLGVSVICLSSCDKEYEAYGYKKDVVYDYYDYEAQFQNGSNKKFKLYKDITAKVDNNCLICSFEFDRYIIDIEHDTFTHFYSSCHKEVVNTIDGSIDYWINDNVDYIKIEDSPTGLKQSYSENYYSFTDNEWQEIWEDSMPKYEYDFDINGNLTNRRFYYYGVLHEKFYSYDINNNLSQIKEYGSNPSKMWLKYIDSFEYDSENHLVSETMIYSESEKNPYITELCWTIYYSDYKKEYKYDEDTLVYQHNIFYMRDLDGNIENEEEIIYDNNGISKTQIDYLRRTKTISLYDLSGKILSETFYYSDYDSDSYLLSGKREYKYDDNNNLILEIYSRNDDGKYIVESKISYTYDLNGNLLEKSYYSDYDSDLILNALLKRRTYECYYYDSDGFLVKKERFNSEYGSRNLSKVYECEIYFDGNEYKVNYYYA